MAELIATNLSKRNGEREVVRHINLAIHDREVVGLLGPNGAGKTTLLHASWRGESHTGNVVLDKQDVTECLARACSARSSYLPQESSFQELSVRHNLDVILEQCLYPGRAEDAAEELLRVHHHKLPPSRHVFRG
jgi:lipopolysaccharide export system ATP-binding protein